MNNQTNLIRCSEYVVITFGTTTQALKGEQVLKANRANFITIPTPREISASCGIAVKLFTDLKDEYVKMLEAGNITIGGIYSVEEEGKQKHIDRLDRTDISSSS